MKKPLRVTDKEIFWLFQTIRGAESCHGMTSEETRKFKKRVFKLNAKMNVMWAKDCNYKIL